MRTRVNNSPHLVVPRKNIVSNLFTPGEQRRSIEHLHTMTSQEGVAIYCKTLLCTTGDKGLGTTVLDRRKDPTRGKVKHDKNRRIWSHVPQVTSSENMSPLSDSSNSHPPFTFAFIFQLLTNSHILKGITHFFRYEFHSHTIVFLTLLLT